jgi:hypothetical protein
MTLATLVLILREVEVPSHCDSAPRTALVSIWENGSLARSRSRSWRCAPASAPLMPPFQALARVSR